MFDIYRLENLKNVKEQCMNKCDEMKKYCGNVCKTDDCRRKCSNVYANCSNVCLLAREDGVTNNTLPLEMNTIESEEEGNVLPSSSCPKLFSMKTFLIYIFPVILAILVFMLKTYLEQQNVKIRSSN